MKLKFTKKRLAASLSVALAVSLSSASLVQAGTTYEMFELVEGEASETGYIPVYDPAEELDPEGMPAGDESSITPYDAISDGGPQARSFPGNDADAFDDGAAPAVELPDDYSQDVDVFSDDTSDTSTEDSFTDSQADDVTPFSSEQEQEEQSIYTSSSLPVHYDLLEAGFGTPVKNQGSLGMCWAFSALESIESGMIRRGLADNSISLSETHLAYSAFHGMNNRENDPTSGETFVAPYPYLWTDFGGNKLYSTATLARGYGAAYESDYPLSLSFDAALADSIGEYESILDSVISDDAKETSVVRLKNCYWLYEINKDGITQAQRADRINDVKSFIYNQGAVEIGLYVKGYSYPYDKETNSFYCDRKLTPNHSVTLIGWDDEKVTAADTPGAFLMQNSWGTDGGEGGLFWISYEDRSIKSPSFYEVESRPLDSMIISQYDGAGYGSVIKPVSDDSSLRISGANVFVSDVPQYLKQVSFYAGAAPLSYTINIYRYVKTSPDTGTMVLSQSGRNNYSGYYTVNLTEEVPIGAGEKFAIELKFDSKNGYVPHERSGNKIITADYGQSYLFDGENWDDMMDIADPDTGEKSVYACNLCIKGIGEQDYSGTVSIAPSKPQFEQVTVTNGNVVKASVIRNEESIDGYDFTLGTSPNFLNSRSYTKVNKNVSSGSTSFTYLNKGTYYVAVHAYRLNAEGKKIFSDWSDVYKVTIGGKTPGTPKLKSLSTGKGTLTATYTKASSAYRYEYVLAKKSFTSVTLSPGSKYKTYTNRKYGKVNLKNIPKGTYYFGVRAYTLLNGKTKVYGKWAVKKVTIK